MMNLIDIIKEAQAAWNWLHGREADAPVGEEDIKGIVELARAAAAILTTEQYTESARQVSETYKKSLEPPPAPPVFAVSKTPEEMREEMANARLRDTLEGIKRLDGLAHAAQGRICPFTLTGEYPRRCLEGKCMSYDSGGLRCTIRGA